METKAPKGKFRVIGRDGPKDTGWKKGDYDTEELAINAAPNTPSVRFCVYDDEGNCVYKPVNVDI